MFIYQGPIRGQQGIAHGKQFVQHVGVLCANPSQPTGESEQFTQALLPACSDELLAVDAFIKLISSFQNRTIKKDCQTFDKVCNPLVVKFIVLGYL